MRYTICFKLDSLELLKSFDCSSGSVVTEKDDKKSIVIEPAS